MEEARNEAFDTRLNTNLAISAAISSFRNQFHEGCSAGLLDAHEWRNLVFWSELDTCKGAFDRVASEAAGDSTLDAISGICSRKQRREELKGCKDSHSSNEL